MPQNKQKCIFVFSPEPTGFLPAYNLPKAPDETIRPGEKTDPYEPNMLR
jgi:hypothetical protein